MTSNLVSLFIVILLIFEECVKTHDIFSLNPLNRMHIALQYQDSSVPALCFVKNNWSECQIIPNVGNSVRDSVHRQIYSRRNMDSGTNLNYNPFGNGFQSLYGRLTVPQNQLNAHGLFDKPSTVPPPNLELPVTQKPVASKNKGSFLQALTNNNQTPFANAHLEATVTTTPKYIFSTTQNIREELSSTDTNAILNNITPTTMKYTTEKGTNIDFENYLNILNQFERQFHNITFNKLASISPLERQENGMSFVQSGLFLQLALIALSDEVDAETKVEIDRCTGFDGSVMNKTEIIRRVLSSLPTSSVDLRFLWSTRLTLSSNVTLSTDFQYGPAKTLHLHIQHLNGSETPEELAHYFNYLVEIDTGGAIRETFVEEELYDGVHAMLLNTIYLRARWRTAPTVLRGSWPFRDAPSAPQRYMRMIRINDVMQYAHLPHWDADAIEISYATPGLRLLILVPRGISLRSLVENVTRTSVRDIEDRMNTKRVAVILPMYTLRMTLLLPNKLEAMGISQLTKTANGASNNLRLSHAIQRLMFWAEAGRNAFKDDGLEWDEAPEFEVMVDRPYLFFVRWQNLTLMNGHFVL